MIRLILAVAAVAAMTIPAISQECYTDASGRQVCPLRKAVRAVVAAPVRLLSVDTPSLTYAIPSASNGCGGMAVATAGCGGQASVRTVYRRAPLRTLRERLGKRRTFATGCGGQAAAVGCGGQSVQIQAASCPCGCGQSGCNCGQAPMIHIAPPVSSTHAQHTTLVTAQPRGNSLYAIALASAQYRAERGIHGHSPIDSNRTSGVGWASHNPTPRTCLGVGGPNYAVVRGRDGFYSTTIGN